MTDITAELRRASAGAGPRGNDHRLEVLELILASLDADADWDENAGEDWATVGRGDDTWGYVHMRIALAFVLRQFADKIDTASVDAAIVFVDSLTDTKLKADRETVLESIAMPTSLSIADFNHEAFTAEDLWFNGM